MPRNKFDKLVPIIPIRNIKDINYTNVEFLLRTTNFDVNKVSSYLNGKKKQQTTFLSTAIYNRDERLVDYLLEKNADVNLKPYQHSLSFARFAVDMNDEILLRKLIAHGVDVEDASSMPGKQTILFDAAYNGKSRMVELLIEHNANLHHEDIHRTTPLIISKSYKVTKILLEKGAKVNAMSEFCGSALMQAVRSSDLSRIKILLDYGAEINCIKKNYLGTEPMVHFMTHTIQTDSLKFFLHLNDELDINILDDKRRTALHVLVTRPISSSDNEKWLPLIQEFLNAGIDINQKDIDQKLPVECSTGRNYICLSEIKKHIIKLICLGCVFVCPKNRLAADNRQYDKLRICCEEEFKIINKTCLIDSKITYLDVLKKSVDELMVELREVDLPGIIETELHQIFPNYGPMIYYKLLKVIHRIKSTKYVL
ncbi:phosphocholine transferase AnkX-like [Cotesia typhae]|uniref:phosphocholine transferase AnkX-like n=1 Tax=Cotesia typhae TaxID=2053667 RepID=UPI003D690A66